jgi:tetratricopeptide (TPR) repeat protein
MAIRLPGTVMDELSKVIELWHLGRRDQARTLCEALVGRNANSAQVLSVLAEIYGSGGETREAIGCLQRVLALSPADAATHRKLGDAQLAAGANAEAAAAYREALNFEPDNERCLNNLGLAMLRLGAHDQAITCFDGALAVRSDYTVARQNRQLALAAQGQAMAERAFVQLRQGRPAEALQLFEQALMRDLDCSEALFGSAGTAVQYSRRVLAA